MQDGEGKQHNARVPTGCKRCLHEGGRASQIKHHTKKNACHCCQSLATADLDGGMFCTQAAEGQTCRCAFHTQKGDRDFLKVRPSNFVPSTLRGEVMFDCSIRFLKQVNTNKVLLAHSMSQER